MILANVVNRLSDRVFFPNVYSANKMIRTL
jgi:hypothetical protein